MERLDASVWKMARRLFRSETTDHVWSNGLHAEQLQRDGHRVVSESEKALYYDRALDLMKSHKIRGQDHDRSR